MKVQSFEELNVWKKAMDLSVKVYSEFYKNDNFGFRDQIQRASLSISNNIAEGFGRGSSVEFIRFLNISKGSLAEVHSLVYFAQGRKYLKKEKAEKYIEEIIFIRKMIWNLIKHLRKNPSKY